MRTCYDFIEYDLSTWPYVVANVKPITPTESQFEDHLKCFEEMLMRNEQFSIMFNICNAKVVKYSFMRRQAQFMKDMQPLIEKNLMCTAIVVENKLVGCLLDFLFKIKTPVRPNKRFNTVDNAYKWIMSIWNDSYLPLSSYDT